MTSHRLVVTVLSAALAAAATLALGASSLAAATNGPRMTQRLALVERIMHQQFVDTGKRGPSPGDHNVVRSDVLDRAGKRVGRLDLDCVITGVGRNMGGLCH